MLRLLCFLILFSTGASLAAQSDTTALSSDRPTQSASAFLVPKGTLQIETGFSITSQKVGSILLEDRKIQNITLNTTQIRFGLSDRVELRFSQDLIKSRLIENGNVVAESKTELIPTSIGARIHLFDMNERGGPQTALLINVGGPAFSEITSGTTLDFRFNMEHSLGENASLGYNVGGDFSNEFNTFNGITTLVFGYSASPKVSVFAELYLIFPDFADAFLQSDFGILYSVNPNFQVDVFAGLGISDFTPDSLIGAGVAIRIPGK